MNTIPSPCTECALHYDVNWATTYDHLVCHGIIQSYDTWFYHEESLNESTSTQVDNCRQSTLRGDDTRGMIEDAFGGR